MPLLDMVMTNPLGLQAVLGLDFGRDDLTMSSEGSLAHEGE